MSKPRTVGEEVEEKGFCLAMIRVADLAMKLSRIPVGEWAYTFTTEPRWRFFMNGGKRDVWEPEPGIKVYRYEVWTEYNGWPAGSFNAAGGVMVGDLEARFLEAIAKEIESVQPGKPDA